MRLPLLKQVILASILASPIAARADAIDDFTFTSSSHTISYSLPSSITFNTLPPPLVNSFGESASTTIDGVPGYNVSGVYYLGFSIFGDLYLYVPSSIFGSSPLGFNGPRFFSATGSTPPASGSSYGTTTATFDPGTYNLYGSSATGTIPYTLTITQEAATTPEPSSLVLLGTGIATLIAMARTRHRRRTSQLRNGPDLT